MATRTVLFPSSLLEQLSAGNLAASARIRELATRELKESRPLCVIPPDIEMESLPVPISESLSEELKNLRGRRGTGLKDPEARILARLAYTLLTSEVPRDHEEDRRRVGQIPSVSELLRALPRPPREEQETLARDLQPLFTTTSVALLEASTGTGKGLVIAAGAYAVAAAGQRALICAPTHQLNAQTLEDLQLVMAAHGPVRVEVVFGRSSFVSPTRLSELLSQPDIPETQRKAAQDWLEQEQHLFRNGARSRRFMASRLEALIPEFPVNEATLGASQQDEAALTYEEQFERAAASDIVIATMSMLAMEVFSIRRDATRQSGLTIAKSLTREERERINLHERNEALLKVAGEGRLGRFFAVFVDEAHRLEEQFALAASKDISVFSLVTQIRDLPFPAESKADIRRAYENLQSIGRKADNLRLGHGEEALSEEARQCLRTLLGGLEKATRRRPSGVDAHVFQSIKEIANTLKREVLGPEAGGNISTLDFSPIYRYPRINIGPRSVRFALDFFWQQFQCGAAFSATLYVSSMSGVRTAHYVANRLSIPSNRRREHTPIIPGWVTDPVTLHLPHASAHAQWAPPKMGTPPEDESWEAYFCLHAQSIQRIAATASGGTLVLCTSYHAVRSLSEQLRAGLETRLIETLPTKFNVSLREFHSRALQGNRPVWISVGSAWTGMNVYLDGQMPPIEDDQILTDLVIPKLPFNLNRLSTEIARRQRSGGQFAFMDGMIDCALMVQQGCGRLIRRPGLKGRHLWILDPRAAARGAANFAGIWQRYRNQTPIEHPAPGKSAPARAPTDQVPALEVSGSAESVALARPKPLFSFKK